MPTPCEISWLPSVPIARGINALIMDRLSSSWDEDGLTLLRESRAVFVFKYTIDHYDGILLIIGITEEEAKNVLKKEQFLGLLNVSP